MTMFPQEPYSQVGGCTHNLTQTTQVQTRYPLPVARVLGYYYAPSLSISHGSLSRILPLRGQFVDTLVLQVIALGHAPTREATYLDVARPWSAFVEGAGQRACTVPTSASTLYRQYSTHVPLAQDFLPAGSGAFIPSRERRRDFPRRFVKRGDLFISLGLLAVNMLAPYQIG